MAATDSAPAMPQGMGGQDPAVPGSPVPETETNPFAQEEPSVRELLNMMKNMMETYTSQVKTLEKKLEEKTREIEGIMKLTAHEKNKGEEDGKLKAMNVKDIKPPGEFSGKDEEFMEWYQRFKTLLISRHSSWKELLHIIEGFEDRRIPCDAEGKCPDLIEKLTTEGYHNMVEQYEDYKTQLFSYLTSYTSGLLHNRVVNGTQDKVFDTMRDVIYRGLNRNE